MNVSCYCGSNKRFSDCCEPVINGDITAVTAEMLMRSRYSAYVIKNTQYLFDSWHSTTRPEAIDMDESVQWLRLKVIKSEEQQVEFIATYRINGKAHKLHEISRFVSEQSRWFYVGDVSN